MLQTMQVFGTFILQDPRKLEVNSCGTAASLVGMTTAPQKKEKAAWHTLSINAPCQVL